jgi:hypothetical protein
LKGEERRGEVREGRKTEKGFALYCPVDTHGRLKGEMR